MPQKDMKFTICHRVTTFNYTHVTFTEADFVKSMNPEGRVAWANLTDEGRKSIWDKVEKVFPFEIGTHTEYDPHTNWVQEWDTEETVETKESWNFHTWIMGEITDALKNIKPV